MINVRTDIYNPAVDEIASGSYLISYGTGASASLTPPFIVEAKIYPQLGDNFSGIVVAAAQGSNMEVCSDSILGYDSLIGFKKKDFSPVPSGTRAVTWFY